MGYGVTVPGPAGASAFTEMYADSIAVPPRLSPPITGPTPQDFVPWVQEVAGASADEAQAANADAQAAAAAAAASQEAVDTTAAQVADDLTDAQTAATNANTDAASVAAARIHIDSINASGVQLSLASWTALAAVAITDSKTGAIVQDSDTGTHTDPVSGQTVNNAGAYRSSTSPAGWARIADTTTALARNTANSIAALQGNQRISALLGVQTTPVTGSATNPGIYLLATPTTSAGVIDSLTIFVTTPGVIYIKRMVPPDAAPATGDVVNEVASSPTYPTGGVPFLVGATGLQTIPIGVAFGAGEMVGLVVPNTLSPFTSGSGSPGYFYNAANAATFTLTTKRTDYTVQWAFNVSYYAVTEERVALLEDKTVDASLVPLMADAGATSLAVGVTSGAVVGLGGSQGLVYVEQAPLMQDWSVTSFHCNPIKAGQIALKRFTLSGTTLTQVGSDVLIDVVPGEQDIPLFPAMQAQAGERLGYYAPNGVIGFTADPGFAFWASTTVNSNVSTLDTSHPNTAALQVGWNLVSFPITNARIAGIEGDLSGKVSYRPPLNPAPVINAIKTRYGEGAAVAPTGTFYSAVSAQYGYDETMWRRFGEPNVLRLIDADTTNPVHTFMPRGGYACTAADLAAIGIVPNDTTPPTIDISGALLYNSVNQAIDTNPNGNGGQLVICLRYAGAAGPMTMEFNGATDISFQGAATTPTGAGLGHSDTRFASTTTSTLIDSDVKQILRSNVPVLATYNGQALTGIFIIGYGYTATANLATEMRMARAAISPGGTLAVDGNYNNPDDTGSYAQLLALINGGGSTANTLSTANGDAIVFVGNSFTEADFNPRWKGWVNELEARTPWHVENYGDSGSTWLSMLALIRQNFAKFGQPFGTIKASRAHFMLWQNDTSVNNIDEIRATAIKTIQTAQAMGLRVSVGSEWEAAQGNPGFDVLDQEAFFASIASETGAAYVAVRSNGYRFDAATHRAGDWYGFHPGVRTHGLIRAPWERHILKDVPRPRKQMKIARRHPLFSVGSLDDLVFGAQVEYETRYQPLLIGQTALTASDGSLEYFDRLDLTSSFTFTRYSSEVLALNAGGTIAYSDYLLIRCVLDVAPNDLANLSLALSDPNVTVSMLDALAQPYETASRYQAFYTSADVTSLVAGATYTSSDSVMTGTWTVGGVWNGAVQMAQQLPSLRQGSGTLTKASGTGPSTIAYTSTAPSNTAAFYQYLGKPPGHWVTMTNDGAGNFTASGADCFSRWHDGDELLFLVHKAGGGSLSMPVLTYTGPTGKQPQAVDFPRTERPARGAETLTTPLCQSLTGWTVTSGSPAVTALASPDDGNLPRDPLTGSLMTGVFAMPSGSRIFQALSFTPFYDGSHEVEVTIEARYNPPRYTPNAGSPPITETSYDWITWDVNIISSNTATSQMRLKRVLRSGLWWEKLVFRTRIEAGATARGIEVGPNGANAQLARVSVRLVD